MYNLNNFNAGRRILTMLLLATLALWLGACESDSVAPQDPLPTPSEAGVAQQAGIVAAGLHKLGPQILRFDPGKTKDVYTYDFPTEPYVTGEVTLAFFTGGAGGTPSAYDVADYGTLKTAPEEVLAIGLEFPGDVVVGFDLTLDLAGDLDQGAGTAVVWGGGTFDSDLWTGNFNFVDVQVTRVESYPSAGTLTFTNGPWEAVVTYGGAKMAVISFGGLDLYMVDLDTGLVTPIT